MKSNLKKYLPLAAVAAGVAFLAKKNSNSTSGVGDLMDRAYLHKSLYVIVDSFTDAYGTYWDDVWCFKTPSDRKKGLRELIADYKHQGWTVSDEKARAEAVLTRRGEKRLLKYSIGWNF